jgi:hypothetical protein
MIPVLIRYSSGCRDVLLMSVGATAPGSHPAMSG